MRKNLKTHSLSSLAALLTFALFAIGILTVLLSGAKAYHRLTQRNRIDYDRRTCVQYIATKLRQAPSPDAVSLTSFGDGDALAISQQIEGTEFSTRIYCHNGWLMELFALTDGGFAPEDGEKILPLESLSFSRSGSLLSVTLTGTAGEAQHLTLSLRGGDFRP